MRFVVIGLGSMGRRRARLLKQIDSIFEIVGVDSQAERRAQAEDELSITTYDSIDEAVRAGQTDGVIISTSPLSHAKIINQCLSLGLNVFTELNLVQDMYKENMALAKEKGVVLFLSSTFLYREETGYIIGSVHSSEGNVNYNYHVGQYLPDWHPWESIQNYFVSDKRTNGCRELFAIELPWIIEAFGEIDSFEVLSDKNSDLPVQYNDNYCLLIKHKGGNKGLLAVDVVSRKAVRNLEIYGENIHLTWNGTPDGLRNYDIESKEEKRISLYDTIDKQDGYASFVIENGYRHELEAFIDLINGVGKPKYTFEDDYKVLSIIDDIEAR